MYTPSCKITIGSVKFNSVNSIDIDRTLNRLGDKAVIKVPVTAVLKREGMPPTKIETAATVKIGDPVTIELGYNGRMNLEFRGWVKTLNLRTPLEIVCENDFYTARSQNIQVSGKMTLKGLLGKLGVDVAAVEELTLTNFAFKGSVYDLYKRLSSDYGLQIFYDLNGRLYVIRPYNVRGNVVRYEFRANVIKDDDLQYKRKSDTRLKIECVCFKSDGSVIKGVLGDDGGESDTLYFYNVDSLSDLKTLAQAELTRRSYDGYDGRIETFLEPYCQPGDVASIHDPIYTERSGDYLIIAVKTSYSRSGARRTLTIGERA